MKRNIIKKLLEWKSAKGRKPLILKGARQVGKTWALQAFAEEHYASKGHQFHYIDFHEHKILYSIFAETSDPKEIIQLLELRLKIRIDIEHDLLIFDEVQECPQALTSLKYFQQSMFCLDLIVAGSHMGLLNNSESFPVGKVNFLHLTPLTFSEFLLAIDGAMAEFLHSYNFEKPVPEVVHSALLGYLNIYLFTGGLPEVVKTYLLYKDNVSDAITKVRTVQSELLEGYRSDFAKYSGLTNATHINCVFDAIARQLSHAHDESINKFIFKGVIPKRKGLDSISGPLNWLLESRLCLKVSIAKKAEHPLLAFTAANKFKLCLFDIGILNCLINVPGETVIDNAMGSYKGYMVENFIAQELFSLSSEELIAWQEGASELEFILSRGGKLFPVEVKSSAKNRRTKSLDAYIGRYAPQMALKMSRQNYGTDPKRGITTMPLYMPLGKILDQHIEKKSLSSRNLSW